MASSKPTAGSSAVSAPPPSSSPGRFVLPLPAALSPGAVTTVPISGIYYDPPWIFSTTFTASPTSITVPFSLPAQYSVPTTVSSAVVTPTSTTAPFTAGIIVLVTASQVNLVSPWNYAFTSGQAGATDANLNVHVPFPESFPASGSSTSSAASVKPSGPTSAIETSSLTTFDSVTGGSNFTGTGSPTAPTLYTSAPGGNSTTSIHGVKSKSISTGGIVGLAIGVAVACALIIALLAFCFLRRRTNRRVGPNPPSESRGLEMAALSTNGGTSTPRKPILATAAMTGDLPQAADDKEVQQRTSTVLDQVDVFVQNFCQPQARSESSRAQENIDLSPLATSNTPILSRSQAAQFARSEDALPLIRHALAWQITAEISSGSSALLPEASATSRYAGGSDTKKSGRSTPSTAFTELRDHEITKAIRTFNGLFSPWFKAKYTDAQRDEALRTIWLEAAKVGTWLMNQPQELQFQWPEGSQASGQAEKQSLAVTPALVKITDDRGQRLSNPQTVVPATFG